MRKITYVSLFVLFFVSYSYSQKRVVSKETTVSTEQNQVLLRSFEEYRVVDIDLKKFKEDIQSLKEPRILWKIDGNTEYDMRIHPKTPKVSKTFGV